LFTKIYGTPAQEVVYAYVGASNVAPRLRGKWIKEKVENEVKQDQWHEETNGKD
jgi:hypothetical protein